MFRTKKRRSSIPEAGSRPSRIFESSRNRSERGLAAARPDLKDVGPRNRGCPISRVLREVGIFLALPADGQECPSPHWQWPGWIARSQYPRLCLSLKVV